MAKPKKIIVVDDEPGIRNLLHGVLTENDFEVTLAQDGQEAWKKVKDQNFDLMITDIDMPRLDGIELLKKMKKSRKKEKVLVMTGRCMEYEDLSHDFPKVFGVLRKPFRISFFVGTVSSALEAQKTRRKQPLLKAGRGA